MLKMLKNLNVGLRGLMETGIVVAFGYWGFQLGHSTFVSMILCILVPLVGFGFWGLVDFHQFGKNAETFRLIQELLISGLAASAFYFSGQVLFAWILAFLSVIHHLLVYITGKRLLTNKNQG